MAGVSLVDPVTAIGRERLAKYENLKAAAFMIGVVMFAITNVVVCLVFATLATARNGSSFLTETWWPRSIFDDTASDDGPQNILVIAVCIAFAVNWIGWIPAALLQTEHFYDLTGSTSFVITAVVSIGLAANDTSNHYQPWRFVPAALMIVWALRLGAFLFSRVLRSSNGDQRFDEIKQSPLRFLIAWTLQATWCALTSLSAFTQLTAEDNESISDGGRQVASIVGLTLWVAGFAIEVCADHQKKQFCLDVANRGRFISTGLWSLSRHPNYFGEMMLWFGTYVMGIRYYQGTQWVCTISPIFVVTLISFVSGLPQLEGRANARWGDDDAYQRYKRRTPLLVLNPILICVSENE